MGLIDEIQAAVSLNTQARIASRFGTEFTKITSLPDGFGIYTFGNDTTNYILKEDLFDQFRNTDYSLVPQVIAPGITEFYQNNDLKLTINENFTDSNINALRHKIAEIQGNSIFETVIELLAMEIVGGDSIRVSIKGENGNIQSSTLDISSLLPAAIVDGDNFDPATLIFQYKNDDNSTGAFDFKTMRVLLNLLADGSIVVSQANSGTSFNVSIAGQSGKIIDLITAIGADPLSINSDDGAGGTGSINLTGNALVLSVGGAGSGILINSDQGGIAIFGATMSINYAVTLPKLYGAYTDSNAAPIAYHRLANAHNSYGNLKYYDNTGVIETNLNTASSDYFLLKNGTSYYFVVKKTEDFNPENCKIIIAGDPILGRATTEIDSPILNTGNLAASYDLYDISAVDVSNMTSGDSYEFTFWRKEVEAVNLNPYNYNTMRYIESVANDFSNLDSVLNALPSTSPFYLLKTQNNTFYIASKNGDPEDVDFVGTYISFTKLDNTNISDFVKLSAGVLSGFSTATYNVHTFNSTDLNSKSFTVNNFYGFTFWRK